MPEIKLVLAKDMISRLDELAEENEVTRSEMIRSLLRVGTKT